MPVKNLKNILLMSFFIFTLTLTGCAQTNTAGSKANPSSQPPANNANSAVEEFSGETGKAVSFAAGRIVLPQDDHNDNQAHYYNVALANGSIVYFFVVQDKSGTYRAAANACQVCHDANMGFRQEGNYMVCNTCGNKYPLEKIATEKGGCNPIPISPDLKTENGNLVINQSDFAEAAKYF
jgi:hypothetical protein